MKISEVLAKKYGISKRTAKRYIKSNLVSTKNKIIKKDIDISSENDVLLNIHQENLKYDMKNFLLKISGDIIFLYKPPFMHTERLRLEDGITIYDIVKDNFTGFKLISRLDFETDGVIPAIRENYHIKKILKEYIALVHGKIDKQISLFNRIDAYKRKKVKVLNEITNNKTEIQPLRKFNEFTLVKVSVKEATRHQIRALLSHINHPIAGDKLYGKKDNFDRLMLRCQRVNINDTICSSKYLKRFIRICKDKAFLKSN
jgi:23S rRNA-/tRNA-specific pseudouridylate synthase